MSKFSPIKGPVIASSLPIRFLFEIEQLDLVRRMYGKVLIPETVKIEILRSAERGRQSPDLEVDWIEVIQPEMSPVFNAHPLMTKGDLDVLRLASTRDCLLLLEPKSLRQAAQNSNYQATGTLGLLLMAKKSGFIPEIAPLLPRLQSAGLSINDNLRNFILTQAGEK